MLINRLTAKPDQRQRVVEILLESGKVFDDNSDCLLYLVTESADDPNLIWVVDLWSSKDAHNQALQASLDQSKVEEGDVAHGGRARADQGPRGRRQGPARLSSGRSQA